MGLCFGIGLRHPRNKRLVMVNPLEQAKSYPRLVEQRVSSMTKLFALRVQVDHVSGNTIFHPLLHVAFAV